MHYYENLNNVMLRYIIKSIAAFTHTCTQLYVFSASPLINLLASNKCKQPKYNKSVLNNLNKKDLLHIVKLFIFISKLQKKLLSLYKSHIAIMNLADAKII